MSWARLLLGPHLGAGPPDWVPGPCSTGAHWPGWGLCTLLASSFQDSGHTWLSLGPACSSAAQARLSHWQTLGQALTAAHLLTMSGGNLGNLQKQFTSCQSLQISESQRPAATNIRGHRLLQAGARVCSVKTDTDCILVRGSAL